MSKASALLLGWLTVTSACVSPRLGTAASAWHTLDSPHFTLHTDLPRSAAEKEAHTLEAQLSAMHATGWEATGDLPQRVHVVMFANADEFREYGGSTVDGYMVDNVLFEPLIVMPAATRLTGLETLSHELTHFMAFQAMQTQPRWFAEGLASYFQTAGFARDGAFEIGRVPENLFRQLTAENWIPPSTLVSGWAEPKASGFYPSSWIFVHYLMTARADEFAAYQEQLARGVGDERAFRAVFKDTPEQLDAHVREYARLGRYEVFAFRVPRVTATVSARPLSRADEYALRALLWSSAYSDPRPERAANDIALALNLEPDHLVASALSLLDSHDTQHAYERARTLAQKHPKDWRAWVTLGFVASQAGKYEELARDPEFDPGAKAPLLAPTQPFAVMMSALSEAARGSRAEALLLAAQAERMQPTNVTLMLIRAELLVAFAECAALEESLSRLSEIAHGRASPQQLAQLNQARATCK